MIINDHPVIAKKSKADGCHLGQKDGQVENARRLLKIKL